MNPSGYFSEKVRFLKGQNFSGGRWGFNSQFFRSRENQQPFGQRWRWNGERDARSTKPSSGLSKDRTFPWLSIFGFFNILEFSVNWRKAGTMDWDHGRKEPTCRSYLENLIDALMMMIPTIPINLRSFEQFLCPTFCPKESMCPLSCTINVNHIRFVATWEKMVNAIEK